MKKIIAMILSLVMVVTITGVMGTTGNAATETNDWKNSAIESPEEGKLIGAGYINIKFHTGVENAKSYQVFFDGKEIYEKDGDVVREELGESTEGANVRVYDATKCGDSVVCEVYATSVKKHTVYVVATLNDGNEITTDTRTFYVSKKGMAMGGDMSDQVAMRKLNVSWYYNWGMDPFNNSIDENVAHVPMMWGGGEDNIEAMKTFTTDSNYILGFNEPDIGSQANMTYWDATKVWGEYITPLKLRKISPAPAAPGGDSNWLKKFMFGGYICKNTWLNDGSWGDYNDYEDEATKTWVAGYNEDVDAVVLHYYRNIINLDGMVEAVNNLWNTYHKPIWITEVSVVGTKGTDQDYSYELPEARARMAEYVKGMVQKMDAIPYVERYCWFSYNIQSYNEIDSVTGAGATAMFDYDTGAFTELGKLYSSIGNPEGYDAYSITEDETYVYVEPTTTEPVITTQTPTTQKQTTTKEQSTTKTEPTTTKAKLPVQAKITTVKNVRKKAVSLKWNKISKVKKYEIQYSTNYKFKKAKKIYTKSVSKKITSLKKNKKYYFRVRAVSSVGCGKWSKVKSIKIKK